MNFWVRVLVLAGIAFVPAAFGGQVDVGDVLYLNLVNGTTQFYLDNFTGVTDGCSTPSGFPICTSLSISGTLTFSYSNGSSTVNGTATLSAPIGPDDANGGLAYAPANFLLPGTTIFSAYFSGTLTPVNFTTDLSSFNSDGTIVSSDVVAGGGFALLTTNSASAVPEPSSAVVVMLGGLVLLSRSWRGRRS
jgi:hypothetical protein